MTEYKAGVDSIDAVKTVDSAHGLERKGNKFVFDVKRIRTHDVIRPFEADIKTNRA